MLGFFEGESMPGRIRVLALAAAVTVVSGAASAQTMTESLAAAYSTNPQLNVARAQLRAIDENIAIARSGNRPLVQATVEQAYTTSRAYLNDLGSNTGSVNNQVAFGVQLTQPLFQGFQVRNNIRQAEAAVRAQRSQLESIEQSILLATANAFIDVLRYREIVSLRRNDVEFLGEQVRAAQDRFEVGEGTRTDVSQAEAARAESQTLLAQAEANLEAARAAYQRQTNLVARDLRDNYNVERLLPQTLASSVQIGLQTHPDIISALHDVDTNIFNVASLEGQFLPTLSATASANSTLNAFTSENSSNPRRRDSASVGLNLTIPIYQRGQASAQVRQAKESLGASRLQVDLTRNIVRQSIASDWATFQAALRSIFNAQTGVFSAQLALQGVIEEQRVGQRTTLDVLDAQRTLISNQITLVTAQRTKDAAAFQVLADIGRLNVRNLGLNIDQLYDPKEHADAVRGKWYGTKTPDGR